MDTSDILFIPTQKQDIVVDLRTTDHRRGEEWSDIIDGGEHPNIRATTIVKDTEGERPKTFPLSPYKANGCKIKRIVQEVPMKICGTPEQVINYLNTLIALFQNGQFGKYKKNKMDSTKAKDKVPQNISVDKDGNWVSANGCGADYVSENKQYNNNRNMKQTIRLNESELKRIIDESVKGVINELDWKTYMSAAQKRKEQGNYKKAGDLSDYANQQFGKQYDINNAEEHERGGKGTGNVIHNGRTRVNFNGGRVGMYQYDNTGAERYHQKSVGQYQSDQDEIGNDFQGNTQNDYSKNIRPYDEPRQTRNQRYLPMSNNFRNKLNTMTKDMFDFYNGKSKYVKGQGWQNESISRKINRIVSESIRRNIR